MFRRIKCSKNNFCQFLQTIWNFVIFNPFVRIRNFTIALYLHLKLGFGFGWWKNFRRIFSFSSFIMNFSKMTHLEINLSVKAPNLNFITGSIRFCGELNFPKVTHRANPSLAFLTCVQLGQSKCERWQLCWWHRHIGDDSSMLVTSFECWCPILK